MLFHSGKTSTRVNGSAIHLTGALACLLFVWFIGVNGLTTVPLANHDELRTLTHILGPTISSPEPLQETVTNVATHSKQHGPLYFVLLNLWSRIAGSDLFLLRLLSAYFALLSLAAVYRFARLSRDGGLALAAMFVLSVNSLFLFYSRELRMYTLLPLLVAWIFGCYWRLLATSERMNWWAWLSLAIGCGLILYVHYFGIFALAAVGTYHLLFAPKNRRWVSIAFAIVGGGLLFLPWAPTVIKGFEGFSLKSMSGMSAFESLLSLGNVYSNDFWILPLAALIIVIWHRRQLDKPGRFILIVTFLAIVILLLANELKPILIPRRLRYMLLLAPLMGSALAIAWRIVPRRAPIQLLLAVAWITAFITYSQNAESYIATKRKSLETLHAPPYYALAYHPEIEVEPAEVVLSLHPSRKITWITGDYYQKLINPANLVHIYYDGGGRLTIQTTRQPIDALDSFVSRYGRFWLLYDPLETNERSMGDIFGWARQYYRSCGRVLEKEDAVVERFVRDSDPC